MELERSLYCRTHNPWFAKLNAVYDLYMAVEMLQVFEKNPLRHPFGDNTLSWPVDLFL